MESLIESIIGALHRGMRGFLVRMHERERLFDRYEAGICYSREDISECYDVFHKRSWLCRG